MVDPLDVLDRELVVSAVAHDLRGAMTAIQGWAELADDDTSAAVEPAFERARELVAALADPCGGERLECLARAPDAPVRARASLALLEAALAGVPHSGVDVEVADAEVRVVVHGVPAHEGGGGWTLAQVRGWLARAPAGGAPPGPGHAGARLRMAVRLLGGGWTYAADASGGTFIVRLTRA